MLGARSRSGCQLFRLLGSLVAVFVIVWAPGSASANHALGGPYHLSDLNLGFSERHIHFDDRTDTTWPVGAAADNWNASSKLFVTRLGCPNSSEYCPIINQVNSNAYYGRAFIGLNAAGTHFTRGSTFYINLSNVTPLSRRQPVACQEEGHLLGLDHRTSSAASCMWDGAPGAPTRPGARRSRLQRAFLHLLAQ